MKKIVSLSLFLLINNDKLLSQDPAQNIITVSLPRAESTPGEENYYIANTSRLTKYVEIHLFPYTTEQNFQNQRFYTEHDAKTPHIVKINDGTYLLIHPANLTPYANNKNELPSIKRPSRL